MMKVDEETQDRGEETPDRNERSDLNDVRRDERQQQHAKQPAEPVTREEATDTRRRKVKHHHGNQIEMWGVVDDVPPDDFGDEGPGYDGIQQVQSYRNPGRDAFRSTQAWLLETAAISPMGSARAHACGLRSDAALSRMRHAHAPREVLVDSGPIPTETETE